HYLLRHLPPPPPPSIYPLSLHDALPISSSSVAPPGPNPVDVLTKLAPASLLNSHALTFSSFVKRPVSIITLTIASELTASTTDVISDFTASLLFDLSSPILMT